MLKSVDLVPDLHSVDVAKVETLICYPRYLPCLCLILEQSAAMSHANLPSEVQWPVNVHQSLDSADGNSVKKLVELLRD